MEEYGTAAGIPLDSFYDGRLGEEEKKLLYDEDTVLVEKPDVRSGVAPHHYADIEPENNPHTTNFHGSKEFASIAFWEMDNDFKFECIRFFIVPIPLKREIQSVESTKLNQVLYQSPHSKDKDVFFFYMSQNTN